MKEYLIMNISKIRDMLFVDDNKGRTACADIECENCLIKLYADKVVGNYTGNVRVILDKLGLLDLESTDHSCYTLGKYIVEQYKKKIDIWRSMK